MPYQFENASVLIVDDMKPMLTLTSSALDTLGFRTVYTADNAHDAFELVCIKDPDIIITDWLMEPMNGIELTQKIRTDPRAPNPYVPIILMTGYSARIRVMEARDKGITEFLVKPFSARDMYVRIEQLIEKPRKFVTTKEFFGPDRRRRRSDDYKGPRRRKIDMTDDNAAPSDDKRIEDILKKLRQEAKDKGST